MAHLSCGRCLLAFFKLLTVFLLLSLLCSVISLAQLKRIFQQLHTSRIDVNVQEAGEGVSKYICLTSYVCCKPSCCVWPQCNHNSTNIYLYFTSRHTEHSTIRHVVYEHEHMHVCCHHWKCITSRLENQKKIRRCNIVFVIFAVAFFSACFFKLKSFHKHV